MARSRIDDEVDTEVSDADFVSETDFPEQIEEQTINGATQPEEQQVATEQVATEPTQAEQVATEPTQAEPAKPAKPKLTDEQLKEFLVPFQTAVSEAVATRDLSTGTMTDEVIASVNTVYSGLQGGAKVKNAAKLSLNEAMKTAMAEMPTRGMEAVVEARSYMELSANLAATRSSTPSEPADPTQAFVERAATLVLAYNLAIQNVPENVDEDWQAKVESATNEAAAQADTYRSWFLSTSEDKGDEPQVSNIVRGAVRLSLGKGGSPKPRKSKDGGGIVRTVTYTGQNRSIAAHILSAFADKQPGDFMLIRDIENYRSDEYGDDTPSGGAINDRLFPKNGRPCTIEGVIGSTDASGRKGGIKQ